MKALYRCDYCDTIGTENEIFKHEAQCRKNPRRLNCSTCQHHGYVNFKQIKCNLHPEREIKEEHEVINCPGHEVRESYTDIEDIIHSMFGV